MLAEKQEAQRGRKTSCPKPLYSVPLRLLSQASPAQLSMHKVKIPWHLTSGVSGNICALFEAHLFYLFCLLKHCSNHKDWRVQHQFWVGKAED